MSADKLGDLYSKARGTLYKIICWGGGWSGGRGGGGGVVVVVGGGGGNGGGWGRRWRWVGGVGSHTRVDPDASRLADDLNDAATGQVG